MAAAAAGPCEPVSRRSSPPASPGETTNLLYRLCCHCRLCRCCCGLTHAHVSAVVEPLAERHAVAAEAGQVNG
jgi:hypothetical protein